MNGGAQGTTMRMVRFALGPQFGTLCFASAVLVVVQLIRSAAEQVMRACHNFHEGVRREFC